MVMTGGPETNLPKYASTVIFWWNPSWLPWSRSLIDYSRTTIFAHVTHHIGNTTHNPYKRLKIIKIISNNHSKLVRLNNYNVNPQYGYYGYNV